MTDADIPAVLEIQSACYTELTPESDQSFRAKLGASPATCLAASLDGDVVGYLVSLPWRRSSPPALDSRECRLPLDPDCLYLHDLAVAPRARSTGTGRALVDAFLAQLGESTFGCACLIAVQGSEPYWKRRGFRVVSPSAALAAKLSTYGNHAVYMELEVRDMNHV